MSKVENLRKYIQSLDGYKIGDTHFKMGSKIHSADFYYAKRLFQNSYYTARLAMLLAIKIREEFNDELKTMTLVGYEMYSELLLSLIKKFLKEFGYSNINHYVITDIDREIRYLPNNVSFNDKIVIVVPISSTGSTTKKITENIKKKSHKATDESFIQFTVLQAYDNDPKFKNFITQQNTLITLETKWHLPSDCELCFHNEISKPLLETDKSSLTPTLIFDVPSAKLVDNKTLNVDFDKVKFLNALSYRKTKRNNEHFLFSTDTNTLINDNEAEIHKWLNKVKDDLNLKSQDKIVIISPCHYTNSQFINLVSDKLFYSSATVIHHQTDVDYLENFKLLNEIFLKQKDTKVFFVDDSLISGKSFFSIYDLYRYTTGYKENLSGAIFLSNKSSVDIQTRVSRTVTKKDTEGVEKTHLYSFVNINLPTHPRISDRKPLEHEVKRYDELSKKTLHDSVKKYFRDKSKDVNGEKIENLEVINKLEDEKKVKNKRHLRMFKATHKAYEYFQNHRNIEDIFFGDLLKQCGFKNEEIEDKMAMLKVLSQYPFLLYKPVREKTFEWHKLWLNSIKVKHKNLLDNNTFSYDQIRELKFLIRRAVFLGNYAIIEKEFFILIQQVLTRISERGKNPIKKTIKIEKQNVEKKGTLFEAVNIEHEDKIVQLSETEEKNLDDFHIFLLHQYVELFHKNGWSANKVMENIKGIEDKSITLQGKQFIRMLKIEAAIVLNDFYELLKNKEEWKKLYKSVDNNEEPKDADSREINNDTNEESNDEGVSKTADDTNEETIELDNKKITEFLEHQKDEMLESNKFKLSDSVLGLKDHDGKLKTQFINYLWLKQFLNTDKNAKASRFSLTEKTEAIFQKFKCLFEKEEDVGAFFVVSDGKNIPNLVYDIDASGGRFLHELDKKNHELILKFMEGAEVSYREDNDDKETKKTIIEYECDDERKNQWNDLYTLDPTVNPKSFVTGCRWVLMIRISDSKFKTLGLIGFYGNKELQNDLLTKRLLMLLREDIGAFIKRHHKNDEFSELRKSEAVRRFAYLAGHGRQMMQRLAQEDKDTFGGVVATMEKLQYLFATKLISPEGYSDTTKSESDKTLFFNIFTQKSITTDGLNNIIKIGNQIYSSRIVENEVELNGGSLKPLSKGDVQDVLKFEMDIDILTLICFELFINAKKNRFHFIGGICQTCETKKNTLEINFSINKENKLVISVAGSGPSIPSKVMDKINGGDPVKAEFEISGLYLINKVIRLLNKDNKIIVASKELCSCCGICENIIQVEFNPRR